MTDAPSEDAAISAALACNWKEAIRINSAILHKNKDNLNASNRLGYAYMKTGQLTQAKRCFQKVLASDQYNQIALKNLKKLGLFKKKDVATNTVGRLSPSVFLEEPGKTKIVECVNLAPIQILSLLSSGQELFLKEKRHCIELRNDANVYLGALPDDLSFKLLKFLSSGNQYRAIVKGVDKNTLTVIIRETSRGKRFSHQPSFIASTSYVPFAKGEAGNIGAPNTTATGEEEDEAAGAESD